jgi:uncharacterized membrane protein
MNKTEFINQLSAALTGLSEEDIKKSVDFYTEMIDDRIEDGMPEEEAVAAVGSIDEIRSNILQEIPITRIVKEKITPKRAFSPMEIVLLIIGAPLWLPLLLTFIIVGLVLYLCFWIIILALYVVDLSVFVSGIAGIISPFIGVGTVSGTVFLVGCGIALLGLSVLLFFGFNQVTKGMLFLSKKIVLGIKKLFVGGKTNEN